MVISMRFRLIKNGAGKYRVQRKRWWGWAMIRIPDYMGSYVFQSSNPRDALDLIHELREAPGRAKAARTWAVIEEI